uniref:Uncharacterized protein LOC111118792 n=1 Tax=Crassostrea virginica TaxID=6565 RepID=A0A8B8CI23_CRAVI|nr:uncharacterized protein LOC111118792 [Crassostrea virginica]
MSVGQDKGTGILLEFVQALSGPSLFISDIFISRNVCCAVVMRWTVSCMLLADVGWMLAVSSIPRIPSVVRLVPMRPTDRATLIPAAFLPGPGLLTSWYSLCGGLL